MPCRRWNVARRRRRRVTPAAAGPLAPGLGLEVQRPKLVDTDDLVGIVRALLAFAVGECVEVEHALLLGLIVRVGGLLPGLYALKGHALLAQQRAQPLVADVLDHPLINQVVAQLGEAPGRERQVVVRGPGERDPLDLVALLVGELRRPPTPVTRIQRLEPVDVEVVDHIADPVLAGECHPRDLRHVHRLRGEQHHLRPTPGHDRPRPATKDPQQPVALVTADRPDLDPLRHRISSRRSVARRFAIHNNDSCRQQGKRCRLRH